MAIEVKVPDIGDYKDVPIIEVHVKEGDTVKADDPLVSLESDKATMDVPAPAAGTVEESWSRSATRSARARRSCCCSADGDAAGDRRRRR